MFESGFDKLTSTAAGWHADSLKVKVTQMSSPQLANFLCPCSQNGHTYSLWGEASPFKIQLYKKNKKNRIDAIIAHSSDMALSSEINKGNGSETDKDKLDELNKKASKLQKELSTFLPVTFLS
eukprot:7582893-Ditylum_brightwellii.AAC.1